ncbi:hypothetical protein CHLNCDRAFT_141584 [Chlorella variabilis]|uniref:Tyrosine-protein kinase ephrin type A/B receptor-like domain-containing protein n=1 Tax=Chlorella variabilis TaxID=554065 RepID=E1ZT93_CHLVA|nr:hypothetical protein CHLNCDRAFT_141584 [Chlorella variabilis]EFN50934.1 hypothetical protein CHLNCDRAFT_141584 [Chlorella variabilis]|eukprot:XP_005843036.1 hypothetical protein CHLNCDRAFT_141584 [Chlorella variabilis]
MLPSPGGGSVGRFGLLALQLAVLGLLVAQQAAAQSCDASFRGKSAKLVMIDATKLTDPYAVCLGQFEIYINDTSCALTVTPAAFNSQLKYKSTMCPTAVLKGGAVIGSDLNAALKRALQTATFAATYVKGATFQADYMGVVVNTTSGNPQVASSVTYAVESSDFSWPELATTQDLCGPTPDCSALVSPCPDGRYNDGAVCAICPAGHECADDALTVCAAGSVAPYAGTAACALCDLDTYRSTAGGSYCEPCPDNAYAHFRGSTGCLACYFGMPKVVAGEIDGVAAFDVMPNEQPRPGYRIATLPAASSLHSCTLEHPFNSGYTACETTDGRMIAIETDVTCEVRVFVLGDSNAYQTLHTIASRPGDVAAVSGSLVSLELSLDGPSPSIVLTDGSLSCTDTGLSVLPFDTTGAATCPAGTSGEVHDQEGDSITVFVKKQCAPCGPGYQCAAGAAAGCSAGRYNPLLGAFAAAQCITCPAYSTSGPAADACQECAAGTAPSPTNPGACELCPAGTYSKYPGSPCLDCPAGTFRVEGGGDGTTCSKCPPGSYSGAKASSCIQCDDGYATPSEGSSSCSPCGPGTFSLGDGSYTCNTCPAGTYSNQQANGACTECPPGQITVNVNGEGATACVKCPVGTWKPPGATDNKCRSCPAGHQTGSTQAGASTCTECPVGRFALNPNTPLCTPCAKAYFAATTGQKVCKACPAGQITDTSAVSGAAADGTGAKGCNPCPARRFRPSMYAANSCTMCPRGRETKVATGASLCVACIPGTTQLATADFNCTACGPGEFAEKPGNSGACKKCPKGYSVPDAGNSACDICGPGTYQDEEGSLECKDCPVGTYTEMAGSTDISACLPAPKGNYAPGTGNDGFIPCEGGTYQDEEGQGACKPCPPGNQCPAGSVAPTKCPPGFYADSRQPWCKECAKGTYQNTEGQRACKPCPAGSYCQATKMVTPTACPAGKYGIKFSAISPTDCAACPINSFTRIVGQTKCTKCSTGLWTARKKGQKLCWDNTKTLPPAR